MLSRKGPNPQNGGLHDYWAGHNMYGNDICNRSFDETTDEDDEQLSDDGGIDMAEDAGLDNMGVGARHFSTPDRLCFSSTRGFDSYRFSMANLEDSQDVELDAIIGELCALETQFDHEIGGKRGHHRTGSSVSQGSGGMASHFSGHSRSSSSGGTRIRDLVLLPGELDTDEALRLHRTEMGLRTDSPDNDSAFSDNVSMLSSESSASSGTGITRTDVSCHSSSSKSSGISLTSPPTQLFIKTFTADGSAKSLLVDEKMTCGYVTKLLADKNHTKMEPKWAIVEHIPDLYLERTYEDHEYLVENLLMWSRDSKNKLQFSERLEKYNLFSNPENYLLIGSSSEKGVDLDDDAKNTLIEEFFSGNGVLVPELEGLLYMKSEGKKAWKKYFFVLRASGLYYCPKGKSKCSRDLMCLTTFDANQIYLGLGWKKKFKAPTDYCFAVKHPQIQTKSTKYMKYLCAEDEDSLKQWMMGMRIAKHGRQLLENYRLLLQDLAEDDLEVLAQARSCSMVCMPRPGQCTSPGIGPAYPYPYPTGIDLPSETSTPLATLERSWGHRSISRQNSIRSSSSSSGCLSERSSNPGTSTPTGEQTGFESDFPMGTIKRKPSMTPKIPLTSTTRSLAKQSMTEESLASALTFELNCKIANGRHNLRRSLTDERISLKSMTLPARKSSMSEVKRRSGSLEKKEIDIDSLPLPPPPLNMGLSMESLVNIDALPPPPPEAYRSLESLPPPPTPPSEKRVNINMCPLPPPPSPLMDHPSRCRSPSLPLPPPYAMQGEVGTRNDAKSPVGPLVPPKPHKAQHRRASEADAGPMIVPPFLAELKAQTMSPGLLRRPSPRRKFSLDPSSFGKTATLPSNFNSEVRSARTPGSPSATPKRLMFEDEIDARQGLPPPPAPPPLPPPPPVFAKSILKNKPPPPIRSDTTRLSAGPSCQSAATSQLASPKAFLADLQRVMEKKWKMAQQLSTDQGNPTYPIMGFRDSMCGEVQNRDYENLTFAPPPPPPLPPMLHKASDGRSANTPKKRPPPPPPKRSDATHLSKVP